MLDIIAPIMMGIFLLMLSFFNCIDAIKRIIKLENLCNQIPCINGGDCIEEAEENADV